MNSKLALITFLDGGPVDPGYGIPGFGGRPDQGLPGGPPPHPWYPGGGGRPDQGLPGGPPVHPWFPGGGPRPDQGLPGYGHPGNALPGYGRPDQGLPGGGYPSGQPVPPPVTPDNTLPTPPPGTPVTLPVFPADPMTKDQLFELKFSAAYGWVIVPFDEDAPVAAPKK